MDEDIDDIKQKIMKTRFTSKRCLFTQSVPIRRKCDYNVKYEGCKFQP